MLYEHVPATQLIPKLSRRSAMIFGAGSLAAPCLSPMPVSTPKDNRQELARACGKNLIATRMSNTAEVKQHVLAKKGRYIAIQDNLFAKEVIVGDGERRRRYILCHNPKEVRRQQNHRNHLVTLLEEELARHPKNDASAQWAIELLASRRFKRYFDSVKEQPAAH